MCRTRFWIRCWWRSGRRSISRQSIGSIGDRNHPFGACTVTSLKGDRSNPRSQKRDLGHPAPGNQGGRGALDILRKTGVRPGLAGPLGREVQWRQQRPDMNKTIRKFSSHEEQKAEVYRYWRSRPLAERFLAVWDATAHAYAFKGIKYDPTRRSTPTLTRIERTRG